MYVATRLTSAMDEAADPCEDFYEFACGTWVKKHVIPEDRSSLNQFGVLRDDVQVIQKIVLEQPVQEGEPESVTKAKDLYKSCMNETLIEQRDVSVIFPFLKDLGGWPLLGNKPGGHWNESDFSLTTLLLKLRRLNNSPLIDLYVSSDEKNSSRRVLHLDQSGYGLPGRKYYLKGRKDRMVMAYEKLANSIAVGVGADPVVAKRDVQKLIDLEFEVAKIAVPAEERRDSNKLYNPMTISQIEGRFTSSSKIPFNWFTYAQGLFDQVGIKFDQSEVVIVEAIPYYQELFNILAKYSKRDIANYIVWSIMQNRAGNLGQRFRDMFTEYNKVVYGTSTARARWRSCVSYANAIYGLAVGRLFVKEAFDEQAKADTLAMIKNLRAAFNELLSESEWMDDDTRGKAREKAKAVQEKIGYQDYILEDKELNRWYQNYTAEPDKYFENVLGNLRQSSIDGIRRLREVVDKNEWTSAPATVNAFYSRLFNRITFPAGILQPPFYEKNQPKSMNYGGIGVVIGHELTHGFDDAGRQYDIDGNLRQWWSKEVINRFKKQTQCIINQYGNFTVPEADNMNLNGITTLGENIADNGGLKESFRAYRNWVLKQGHEERRLPGVEYNHNQLFFINFAQVWCGNMRKESIVNRILTDPHSPGRFRVIGTLQNSADFAKAFKCSGDSYMNPAKKWLSLENFAKCTNHNQCPENSICSPSACDGYTCRCREGYVSSDDKVQCLPVRRMGDRCDASNKCLSPFSLCEDSCFCNDLLEATQDGRCKDPLFRYVGETCWMDPCQQPALCSDEGMCVCPPGMRKLKNEEFWLNPMIITQCVENDFSVHSCKGKLLEIPAGLLPTTPTIAPMTKPATSPVPSTTSVQQPSIEPIKPPMAQFLSTMPLRPTTETLPDTTSVPLYKIIYPDRRFPRRAFEICTNNTQCPENSRCRPRGCMGYVCICDEGYIASDNRHYCLKATKVGEPCNRLESKCMSPFSYCDGECRCLDVFEPTSDGRCKLPGIGFQGDTCSNSSCEYPAECLNGRCTCTGDYRPVSEEEFWVDPSDLRQCRKKSTSLTSCNGVVVPVPDEMKVSTTSTMKATTPLSSSASTEIQTTSTEPQTTSTEPQTTSTEPQTTTEPETTTEPQTTSPEPQITTTEPQITTTEPQTTTTTEPQTTTTEPQTTTTEQQTTTTEPQTTTTTEPQTTTTITTEPQTTTTTTELLTTTEPQTTTTTTELRTTTEPQTTTTEPKTTTEPQITTTEPPTTTKPQTTTTEPQTTTTSTEPPTTSTDPPTTSTETPTTSTETPTTSTELQTTSTESKSTSTEPQSTTSKTRTTESQTSTSAPTTTDPQTSSTIQQATDFKTTVTNQITSTKPQTTSSSKQSTTEPRTFTSQQATDTQTTTSSLTTQEETTTTIAQTLTNTGQDIAESTISTEFSKITTENHISTTLPQTTAFQSTTTTTTEQTTSEAQTTSTSSPEQQTTTTRTSTEKGNEWQSTLKQSVTITIPQTTTSTSQITSETLQNTLKSETTDREIQTTAQSEPTTTQSITSTPSETTTEYGIPVTTTGVNTMKNPTINTHITESQAATTTSQTTPQIGNTSSGQQTNKRTTINIVQHYYRTRKHNNKNNTHFRNNNWTTDNK
ncbi:hypothetical protein FSP39_016105 [Pinctada imbricata]|uniref:EGF-like domain-containing protein n=1 Tax=Pinctada imbricata TaxID=66713 RepID=A0AA88YAP0_PINIB|nr:hypothetical protein FSP39_016105 [Pinctada imbricata]